MTTMSTPYYDTFADDDTLRMPLPTADHTDREVAYPVDQPTGVRPVSCSTPPACGPAGRHRRRSPR